MGLKSSQYYHVGEEKDPIMFSVEKRTREWLKETTWWNISRVKRETVLFALVKDGLIPFIESKGYKLGRPARELFSYIAKDFYMNYYRSAMDSEWTDVPVNMGIAEERIHYYDTISVDDWTTFWSEWSDWDEIATDGPRGRDRQIDIEEFVWRQLDLDNSPQTEVLYYRMNDESEQDTAESEPMKKPDVYLEEASGWGGLRK